MRRLKDESEEVLKAARSTTASPWRVNSRRVPIWELSNELENFAIIMPCEQRDDGSQ